MSLLDEGAEVLEPFRAGARAAAKRAWGEIPKALRVSLSDAGGGRAKAQAALGLHVLEALRVERWLTPLGVRVPALEGPAARALAAYDEAGEVRAALLALPELGADSERERSLVELPAPDLAELLFGESFSIRAQKRRGGVYTRRALVDALLDLTEWGAPGGPQTLWEPAVGAGAFLCRAWERALAGGRSAEDASRSLVGGDVHPFACHAARVALAITAARLGVDPALAPRVERRDALLGGPAGEGPVDLVVGNPPWVRGERIPKALRERYRARFPETVRGGNCDLAGYFVAAALRRLSPAGRLAFVVSQGVLDAGASAGVRGLLTPGLEAIADLEWGPQAFPGANVIPSLLVAAKTPLQGPVRLGTSRAVESAEGQPGLVVEWAEVPRERWAGLSRTRWAIHLRDPDLDLIETLARAPRGFSANYGIAVRTRVGAEHLVADGPQAPDSFEAPRPLRDGRDVVAWAAVPVRRWIDYRRGAISDPKSEAFFQGPKVLVPRIALTPQAWVDEGDALFRNTLMVVRGPLAAHALAAVVNGLPLRYFAYHLLRAGVLATSHRCTIYSGVISDFPLPPQAIEDTACAARLSDLARECARLAEARDPGLSEAERALDEVLIAAYGLSAAQGEHLRARVAREPLASVVTPTRLGDRRRSFKVQGFQPGARYA